MTVSKQSGASIHPGPHVRQKVLPTGMIVTRAATLPGVGRPTLSTFLNGKAWLSQNMARRLERVFGVDRDYPLDLQAQHGRRDEALRAPFVAGRHTPTLAEVEASLINE